MWRVLGELGERLGVDALGVPGPVHEVDDLRLLSGLLSRARADVEDVLGADGAVVAERKVVGWVRERVLPGGRWSLAPDALVTALGRLPATEGVGRSSSGSLGPLLLVPRRQLRQLNSQLPAGTADGRRAHPTAQLHPRDADERGIEDGEEVLVRSRVGSWQGRCEVTPSVRVGTISIPHGSAPHNVCVLTSSRHDVDGLTGMVAQTAVEVEVRSASA